MKDHPADQTPASSSHAAEVVNLQRTVYANGHWREMTMDSLGRLIKEVEPWPGRENRVRAPTDEHQEEGRQGEADPNGGTES